MDKKLKKSDSVETPQQPFDYRIIEELREKAWADPQVKKNWEEFDRKQQQSLIENNKNPKK